MATEIKKRFLVPHRKLFFSYSFCFVTHHVFSLSPFEVRNRHLSAGNPTVLAQTIRVKNWRTSIYKWNESIHFWNFDNWKQIKVFANEIKKHFSQGTVLFLYPFKIIHFGFAIFIITRLHHLHLRSPLIVWMAHNFLLIEFHFPHLIRRKKFS